MKNSNRILSIQSSQSLCGHCAHSLELSEQTSYEGYPENKFRLRILTLQRCGHDGAQACRVFGFFVKAWTQFADI